MVWLPFHTTARGARGRERVQALASRKRRRAARGGGEHNAVRTAGGLRLRLIPDLVHPSLSFEGGNEGEDGGKFHFWEEVNE